MEKFERLGIKMFGKFQYIVFYSQCKNAEAEKFSWEKDVLLFLFVKFFKNLFKIKQLCPPTAAVTLFTHPHKKGPVMKNYTRHLTSFSMVIYQAEHNLWCPVNVGWENFAQLQKFQVK